MNFSTTAMPKLDLELLNAFCSANIDEEICIAIKLRDELTLDDIDYAVSVPSNGTNEAVVGKSKVELGLVMHNMLFRCNST